MPIHDWTKVPSGLFHHFHQGWAFEIVRALNRGRLPKGLTALVEQRSGPLETDVLAVEKRRRPRIDLGGVATLEEPKTQIVRQTTKTLYARRASRVVVRHHMGEIIAVIEIVSPGNKDSKASLGDFVDKTIDLLLQGVHVLVVDLFPPTVRDPSGIHKAIWDQIHEEEFSLPKGKNRVLVSYESGGERKAYVDLLGVGDVLPDMPLFLDNGAHIKVPLESTYNSVMDASGEDYREIIETGIVPNPDAEGD